MYRAGDLKVLAAIASLAGPAIDQARDEPTSGGRRADGRPAIGGSRRS